MVNHTENGAAEHSFSTRAVHAGQHPCPTTGAIIPPIYMTSTYVQEWPAKTKGYDYTRAGNPNFDAIESQVASLEGGQYATVFSAGLAAFTALCAQLKSGDSVAALKSLYGGTYRLLTKIFQPMGVKLHMVQVDDWKALEGVLADNKPKMLLFETPTNPLLEVIDIARMSDLAKKYGALCVCDNTFCSPYIQRPLELGADLVIHSTTKYIGGHSDVVGGIAITNDKALKERLDYMRMCLGLNPSPFDCWLVCRSLKTLAIRMERHCSNAQAFAEHLVKHPKVAKVFFPGLPSHPNHDIAKKQMKGGFSGMVSVEFKLSLEETKKLISSTKVFSLAESLGGVESLVDHPASMTHASIPAEERAKIGLNDGLVRFSVGIENIGDLVNDVEQAITVAQKA